MAKRVLDADTYVKKVLGYEPLVIADVEDLKRAVETFARDSVSTAYYEAVAAIARLRGERKRLAARIDEQDPVARQTRSLRDAGPAHNL